MYRQDAATVDLNNECNENEMKDIEEIRSAIEDVDYSRAVQKIKKRLEDLASTPLDIAITGESGSGKSTFINTIRGLTAEDEGAAKVGAIETTMEATPYSHPYYENVKWWDLPGIGTPNFKAKTYLRDVYIFRYDFFIILASERFRENDTQLALAIQNMGKKFYFVRSKIDVDISSMRRQKRKDFDKEALMQEIRENCTKNLSKIGIRDPKVFLIDSLEKSKYDFEILQQTLEKELPSHKRNVFLLSVPIISKSVLERKRDALKQEIKWKATASCGAAIIPIPGLGFACDVTILVKALTEYQKVFGLDEQSFCKLSKTSSKSVEDLKSVIKSPQMVGEITDDIVMKMLTKMMTGTVILAGLFVHYIPVIGTVTAAGVAFATTYNMLQGFLEESVEDALRVLNKTAESCADH